MIFYRFAIVLYSFLSLAHSAVIENDISFVDGQGIVLSQNKAITLCNACSFQNCPIDSVVHKNSDIDFAYFATGFWDDLLGGCGGTIYSVLSKDTVWLAKKPDIINKEKIIKLSDTTLFERITEVRTSDLTEIACPDFLNPCGSWYKSWTPSPVEWYIGRTNESQYFLFRFISNYSIYDSTIDFTHSQATIHYILQTDGSLNFNQISKVIHNNPSVHTNYKKETGAFLTFGKYPHDAGAVFDIQGRRIKMPLNELKNGKMPAKLYINSSIIKY